MFQLYLDITLIIQSCALATLKLMISTSDGRCTNKFEYGVIRRRINIKYWKAPVCELNKEITTNSGTHRQANQKFQVNC